MCKTNLVILFTQVNLAPKKENKVRKSETSHFKVFLANFSLSFFSTKVLFAPVFTLFEKLFCPNLNSICRHTTIQTLVIR